MNNATTLDRLAGRLDGLLEGLMSRKEGQIDFLIGLNRLDDILVAQQTGQDMIEPLAMFLGRYRSWLEPTVLKKGQQFRVSKMLSELLPLYIGRNDADGLKITGEVRYWLKSLGNGSIRLTAKSKTNQGSLSDNYRSLLKRENEELSMLLDRSDHLLGCLDDLLKSAEAKTDSIYQHMAASIIYYLQLEGYKIDPYIERLRMIKQGENRR